VLLDLGGAGFRSEGLASGVDLLDASDAERVTYSMPQCGSLPRQLSMLLCLLVADSLPKDLHKPHDGDQMEYCHLVRLFHLPAAALRTLCLWYLIACHPTPSWQCSTQ
jgi:hypothetical protein